MRIRCFVQVLVASVLLISCASGELKADAPGACSVAEENRAVGVDEHSPQDDLLRWAGFADVTNLEVLGADEECGLDASARIALKGDSAAIDAALVAADFGGPPTGMAVQQTPFEGVDLDGLTEVVSSDQQGWENGAGERLVRMYVRGRTGSDNEEVLHVWAFTT